MTHMRLRRLAPALAAVGALVLAGCGGDGEDPQPPAETPAAAPSVAGLPEDVELTEAGSQLAFGDTATVAHVVGDRSGVLALTVESARQGRKKDFVGFELDSPYKRRGNYYYVRVSVTNAGEKRFGGIAVPLWGVSGDDTLLQPVQFTSAFTTCPTERTPKPFEPGQEFRTCLVFLSPDGGELKGVSYRPDEDVLPIEWRGEVEPARQRGAGANGGQQQQ